MVLQVLRVQQATQVTKESMVLQVPRVQQAVRDRPDRRVRRPRSQDLRDPRVQRALPVGEETVVLDRRDQPDRLGVGAEDQVP